MSGIAGWKCGLQVGRKWPGTCKEACSNMRLSERGEELVITGVNDPTRCTDFGTDRECTRVATLVRDAKHRADKEERPCHLAVGGYSPVGPGEHCEAMITSFESGPRYPIASLDARRCLSARHQRKCGQVLAALERLEKQPSQRAERGQRRGGGRGRQRRGRSGREQEDTQSASGFFMRGGKLVRKKRTPWTATDPGSHGGVENPARIYTHTRFPRGDR